MSRDSRREVERALLIKFMGENEYERLVARYDHETVYRSWSNAVQVLEERPVWFVRLFRWAIGPLARRMRRRKAERMLGKRRIL